MLLDLLDVQKPLPCSFLKPPMVSGEKSRSWLTGTLMWLFAQLSQNLDANVTLYLNPGEHVRPSSPLSCAPQQSVLRSGAHAGIQYRHAARPRAP